MLTTTISEACHVTLYTFTVPTRTVGVQNTVTLNLQVALMLPSTVSGTGNKKSLSIPT